MQAITFQYCRVSVTDRGIEIEIARDRDTQRNDRVTLANDSEKWPRNRTHPHKTDRLRIATKADNMYEQIHFFMHFVDCIYSWIKKLSRLLTQALENYYVTIPDLFHAFLSSPRKSQWSPAAGRRSFLDRACSETQQGGFPGRDKTRLSRIGENPKSR